MCNGESQNRLCSAVTKHKQFNSDPFHRCLIIIAHTCHTHNKNKNFKTKPERANERFHANATIAIFPTHFISNSSIKVLNYLFLYVPFPSSHFTFFSTCERELNIDNYLKTDDVVHRKILIKLPQTDSFGFRVKMSQLTASRDAAAQTCFNNFLIPTRTHRRSPDPDQRFSDRENESLS